MLSSAIFAWPRLFKRLCGEHFKVFVRPFGMLIKVLNNDSCHLPVSHLRWRAYLWSSHVGDTCYDAHTEPGRKLSITWRVYTPTAW